MIRILLSAYTAAEQACRSAAGRVDDDTMDFLTDAAGDAERAVRHAFAAGEGDEAARVEFGRLWLGFNEGCEPRADILAILASVTPTFSTRAAA